MNFISKWLMQRKINRLPVGNDVIITDRPIEVQIIPDPTLKIICDGIGIPDLEDLP